MALELENLLFRVESSQLDDARIKLAKLGDAVNALNKPMQDFARSSAKTNEVIAKSELAAEKARQAQKSLTTETENSSEVVKKQTSVLERQQMILEFMTQGYSKGQSSQLAYAKAAGAITTEIEQLGKVLQTQRTLMGTDPFDKSIGAMQALKNEYTVIKEVQRLYNAELGLSRTQMEDLAKEKIRLIEKYKLEGKTLSDIKEGIIDLNQQYIRNANAENSIISAMKDKQDILKSQAAAEAYLAKETERVNRLIEAKGEITSSTNNRLIKYEQALKASGVSSEVAAAKLAKYKEQLQSIQQTQRKNAMDNLAGAISPQLTDIFVGLSTGQNPLTVLLQQGGQLRDLMLQSKVPAEKYGEAMIDSFVKSKDSVVGLGKALAELAIGGFTRVGRAASDMVGSVVPDVMLMDKAMEALSKRFPELSRVFSAVGGSFKTAVGATIIAAVTSLSIALYQAIKEQDAFAKQLALTSGSLGFTQQSAVDFAKAMTTVEVSTTEAIAVMATMAKTGGFVRDEIQMVTDTAVQMNKWLGVSVEDTVKQYAKLKEDPVKALNEIAKTTGLIPVSVLETVRALKEQGNESEAASVAMKAYADVAVEQIGRVKQEYSTFATLMIELGATLGKFWDGIKAIWYKDSPTNRLKSEIEIINSKINSWGIGGDYKKELEGQRAELTKQLLLLENANMQEDQRVQKQAEQAKWMADNSKALDKNLSKQEKWKIKQKELADDFATGVIASQETYDKALAGWKRLILGEDKKPKKDPAIEQLKKDLDAFNDLMNKSEGQNKSYNNNLEALNRLRKEGKITQEQYNDALGYLVRSQPGYVKKMQELTQSAEDYDKAVKDVAKTVKEWSDSADVEAEKLNLRQKLLGLSAEEQARVNAEYDKYSKLKKLDLDLENALNAAKSKFTTEDFEQVQKPKIIAANAKLRENVERESSIKIAEQQIEEFNKTRDAISGAIADALFEGGKKGADSLKNYLKTTFRKFVIDVFINPIVGSIMGSLGVQGGLSGTAGSFLGNAGGSLLSSTIGSISGVASAFGTAFSNAALSTVQGWVGMSGTAAQMGTSLANAGYWGGSAAGTTASGIGASIGAYAPYALAAIAAYKLLSGNGETRSGATYVQGSNGLATYQQGPSGGEIAGQVSRDLFNSTKSSIENVLKSVGSSATLTGFTAGLESSNNGKGFAFAGGFIDGQSFGASSGREGYRTGQWSYRSMSSQEAFSAYVSELNKATLEALLAARDVPNLIKNQLQGIDFKAINEADVEKLVNAVNETIAAVNDFITQINWMGIEGLSNIDFSKASGLVESFGSVGKASESLSYFYENFYSDAEKTDNLSKKLTKSFSALGFEMPKTRDEFKKLVLSVIELGDPALLKDVLSLQDGFVSMTETAVNSFKELTDGIQGEIDRLLGTNLTSASSTIQGSAIRTEFDILSALARGGDATALARLPEFSQAIEKNMTDFASSASDVIFARAMLAQSLSDTMSSLGGNTTVVPSTVGSSSTTLSSSVVTGGTSLGTTATSQSDLISSLIAEIQGLRAEVRADVSANSKTAKILERANQDGETISVTLA